MCLVVSLLRKEGTDLANILWEYILLIQLCFLGNYSQFVQYFARKLEKRIVLLTGLYL